MTFGCATPASVSESSLPEVVQDDEDIDAAVGSADTTTIASTTPASDSDSSLKLKSYPEWVQHLLPTFREEAKREWTMLCSETSFVEVSTVTAVVPEIVIVRASICAEESAAITEFLAIEESTAIEESPAVRKTL